jgi:hypothetical protein
MTAEGTVGAPTCLLSNGIGIGSGQIVGSGIGSEIGSGSKKSFGSDFGSFQIVLLCNIISHE